MFSSMADYEYSMDQALMWSLGKLVGPVKPHILHAANHIKEQADKYRPTHQVEKGE